MPGDVPQGRRGRPAHRERHRRLALEVQRDPALRAEHDLPEMVVTVDALDRLTGPVSRATAS